MNVLLQMLMGEKFGRDSRSGGRASRQPKLARPSTSAVAGAGTSPSCHRGQLMSLNVGDTPPLDRRPGPAGRRSAAAMDTALHEGRMGRVGDRAWVRVAKPLRRAEDDPRDTRTTVWTNLNKVEAVSNGFGLMIESLRGGAAAALRSASSAQPPPSRSQGRRHALKGTILGADHRPRSPSAIVGPPSSRCATATRT